MNNSRLNRGLALFNLFVITLLCFDTFILQPKRMLEICNYYSSIETRDVAVPSHWTNFIHTKSGKKIREPNTAPFSLESGDTFYIDKSVLFNRTIKLYYRQNGNEYRINSGAMNDRFIGLIVSAFVFQVSVLNISRRRVIKKNNLNERFVFIGTAFVGVLLFFYFFYG